MVGKKTTLTAATAAKVATGGVGTVVIVETAALTDLYLGGDSGLTSDGATSFKVRTATPYTIPLEGELWAISAAGGAMYVLTNNT